VDVEHTQRAKGAPRPLVFRDSALKKQVATILGWESFDADRMFETLSGISVNVDMVTLHFKDGGSKALQGLRPAPEGLYGGLSDEEAHQKRRRCPAVLC
jgi:hypothetical protein